MFRKIIVAVDLIHLERGRRILERAKALADSGGEIVLVNVVEDVPGYLAIDLPGDVIEKNLKNALADLEAMAAGAELKITSEVRTGPPARNILAAASEHEADLIIVASHRPDISNYFLGSTADRVVRHAHVSVLVDR